VPRKLFRLSFERNSTTAKPKNSRRINRDSTEEKTVAGGREPAASQKTKGEKGDADGHRALHEGRGRWEGMGTRVLRVARAVSSLRPATQKQGRREMKRQARGRKEKGSAVLNRETHQESVTRDVRRGDEHPVEKARSCAGGLSAGRGGSASRRNECLGSGRKGIPGAFKNPKRARKQVLTIPGRRPAQGDEGLRAGKKGKGVITFLLQKERLALYSGRLDDEETSSFLYEKPHCNHIVEGDKGDYILRSANRDWEK